jgi:hypothetical protein
MFDFLNYLVTTFVLIAPFTYFLILIYRLKSYLLDSKFFSFCIIFLPLISLHKIIFFDQTLSAQDFNNIQIPFYESFRNSLHQYFLVPIWDNTFGGGFDSFSNPLAFYFSTFALIFYITNDVYLGANLYIYFQLVFLGMASYVLLRELGFKKFASFGSSIFLTFNGFVMMRLSPGIGIEYLYTYKWIPLLLLFTFSYFYKKIKTDWIFVSISLAFLFEGNPNIAFASILFWIIFTLFFSVTKKVETYVSLVKIGLLSILIYSIKLIPGFYLMTTSGGRISELVSGWRVSRVSIDRLLSYYLPLKDNFLPGPFTPGLIGFTIFILGIFTVLYIFLKNRKIEKIYQFSFLSLLLGILICSENFISTILFSLPIFNRLTINPSFYIFLIFPVGVFAGFFYNFLIENFPKKEKIIYLLISVLSIISFFEVLRGPAIFGKSSYSFNFDKMKIAEIETYDLFNNLKTKTDGSFTFIEGNKIFNLPNVTKIFNLKDTNKHIYFYGSSFQKELSKEDAINFHKLHSNYLITLNEVQDSDLEFLDKVSMHNYLKDYQNYAILINKDNYYKLIQNTGWDENLRIYRVKDSFPKKSANLSSLHPYSYSLLLNEKNIENSFAFTSISYSKNWIIKKQNGKAVEYEKDVNGFLLLKDVKPYEIIYFTYVNYYIYFGFLLSFISYFFVIYYFIKFNIKKI